MLYKYSIKTAAMLLRDKVNEPWRSHESWLEDGRVRCGFVTHHRKGGDRISLADAEAYCLDVRDNHERMAAWRDEHPDEPYPRGLCKWERSHKRKLFTVASRGPAYCRMVECEHHLRVNVPLASMEVAA